MRSIGQAVASVAITLTLANAATAQTKISIGCTATTDCASAFVARDLGLFAKRGIEAEMVLVGINPNIPPALMSNSLQIGGPTAPVFLQAADGGLDLVAIAGASVTDQRTATAVAIVARTGVDIKTAKDLTGKKVGVPGIGAFLHVLLRQYLTQQGVDHKSVNFVEVTFPTMSDVLKAGSVDAVLTGEPFMSRIVANGTGTIAIPYLKDIPDAKPVIFYATTRAWAEANAKTVAAFREAVAEAAQIVNETPDKARPGLAAFTKLPPPVVATMQFSKSDP